MTLSFLENCQIIDLTHDLSEHSPTWTGDCGFHSTVDFDYSEVGARVMSYRLFAGVGTHMDAPSHFTPNSNDIASLPITNLVVPLCIIRVLCDDNPDYLISKADILKYESLYGAIPMNSLVAADTGWAKKWDNPEDYRNLDSAGKMHFPGFSSEAVELLLDKNIVGVGIDTLSPDPGDSGFPVHHLLLSRGKYIIENLANLDKVPENGAWIIALPPKIKNGAEAPCRCLALFSL